MINRFQLNKINLTVLFLLFFSFYRLCLQLSLSKNKSIICSFSFLLIPAATVSSFLISTDLLLLLFWVLAMSKLLEIRKDGSVINFVLLGVFLGGVWNRVKKTHGMKPGMKPGVWNQGMKPSTKPVVSKPSVIVTNPNVVAPSLPGSTKSTS